MDNSDNMEIVALHPYFVAFLEQAEQNERVKKIAIEVLRPMAEAATEAIKQIMERLVQIISPAVETLVETLSDLMATIKTANQKVEQGRESRKTWRAEQRRFAQVEKAKLRQYQQAANLRNPNFRKKAQFARYEKRNQ